MVIKTSDQLLGLDDNLIFEDGVPRSTLYDDLYYHADSGLDESRTVFLKGNDLPNAWQGKSQFVIGETGFGTGLNFLATLEAFDRDKKRPDRLIYFSFDQTPLSAKALSKAHQAVGADPALSAELIRNLPPPSPGCHPRWVRDNICLMLVWGEALTALSTCPHAVHAWFLDGFSPAKNPDMWRQSVCQALASASAPGATLASFTAAGAVRRGLADVGFTVDRVKGYGNKRHRINARLGTARPALLNSKAIAADTRWAMPPIPGDKTIAILGAGIAGLSLAWALKRRGRDADIISSTKKHAASTVPVALLAPRLPADHAQEKSRIMARAYAYALAFPPYQGAFLEPKGLLLKANDGQSFDKMVAAHPWGEDWWRDHPDGLFLPNSGALQTTSVLENLGADARFFDFDIVRLEAAGKRWRLHAENGACLIYDAVIIATASGDLLPPYFQSLLTNTPGQTVTLPADPVPDLPDTAVMDTAYVGPVMPGPNGKDRLIGATRETGTPPFPDPALSLLEKFGLPGRSSVPNNRWSGHRLEVPDHLPLVGPAWDEAAVEAFLKPLEKDAKAPLEGAAPIIPGLYLFTGFGSRGFQYAPYMADLLAQHLTPCDLAGDSVLGNAPTLPEEWAALHPARFYIRRAKRSGHVPQMEREY